MTKIFIHVGMPKTGTTAIQSTLNKNEAMLSQHGVIYPKSGRSSNAAHHHAFFLSACSNRAAIRTPLPSPEHSFSEYAEQMKKEITEAKSSKAFLSSELLWNSKAFDATSMIRIRDAFSDFDVALIAYLRPDKEHSLSGYQQRIKGPQCFSGNMKRHLSHMRAGGVYEYMARLRMFSDVFGSGSVLPVWYPDVRQDSLFPIRYALGLKELQNAGVRSNVSLPIASVFLLRYANMLHPRFAARSLCGIKKSFAGAGKILANIPAIEPLLRQRLVKQQDAFGSLMDATEQELRKAFNFKWYM